MRSIHALPTNHTPALCRLPAPETVCVLDARGILSDEDRSFLLYYYNLRFIGGVNIFKLFVFCSFFTLYVVVNFCGFISLSSPQREYNQFSIACLSFFFFFYFACLYFEGTAICVH